MVNAEDDFAILRGLLDARYSCRAFRTEKIPRADIERIIAAAQRTPSDCNIQPWHVTILCGDSLESLRRAMYERAASGASPISDIALIEKYTGVYQDRRRECGWALYEAVGIARGDRQASGVQALENFQFFGAPHLALITVSASLGVRGAIDCGGYVLAFMLAAQALGIATIAQASIAYRADIVREELRLREDRMVVCGIAFGRADETHPANSFRMGRAPIAETVEFIGI
jgi:nitroreductase